MKKTSLFITSFILTIILSTLAYAIPIENEAVQISAGSSHSLAIKRDGTVWAWGSNGYGQLGDGSSTTRISPVQLSGLSNAIMIVAGFYHSLALKNDGSVWAWGSSGVGDLGDGKHSWKRTPVQVMELSQATMIAVGYSHILTLKDDGSVWAWGYNISGQLGDGSTINKSNPVQVPGLSHVTMIAAGAYYSLALKDNGSVWAWGDNSRGQLGDGSRTSKSNPVHVTGLSRINMIAAGGSHSLAMKDDGSVWAWGENQDGQLGDGSTTYKSNPVPVSGFSHVTMIAAGSSHSLAMKDDGSIWAWGENEDGQLGDGGRTSKNRPVQISKITDIIKIAAGSSHSLAINKNGSVWAWGSSHSGRLGDGIHTYKKSPVQVTRLSYVDFIEAGSYHSIALKEDGSVWAWGHNYYGQLGDGSNANMSFPVQVSGVSHVKLIAAGNSHNLALKEDGSVWAWGHNYYGQLGDGNNQNKNIRVQVSGLSSVTMIAAGYRHSLALKEDSSVWAWGRNVYGQLGDGSTTSKSEPVQVSGLSFISMIASGIDHSLALQDGAVWAWGDNHHGQLGDGSTTNKSNPVQVTGLSNVTMIAAGFAHSLALKNDGTVWAWGYNNIGQLGDGNSTDKSSPVQVAGLSNVTMITSKNHHSLALKGDGSVWAWGYNGYGQLGDGNIAIRGNLVQVAGLSDVIMVAAGDDFSLALKDDGSVWAWGYNGSGRLGIGYPTYLPEPVFSEIQFISKSLTTSQSKTINIPIRNTAQKEITFSYCTIDATAIAGIDYLSASGTITFQANETQKDIQLTILDNPESQQDKTFILNLDAPDDIFLNDGAQTIVTISSIDTVNSPYTQTFSHNMPASGWTYYSSTPNGRIQQIAGRLRMDTDTDLIMNLNEAILNIDLSSADNIHLNFAQKCIVSDLCTSLPAIYTGHFNGDGVSVSTDGHTWYRIIESDELLTDNLGKNYEVDLSAVETEIQTIYDETFHLKGFVQIKFQQYGNRTYPSGGREWDDIAITNTTIDIPTITIESQTMEDPPVRRQIWHWSSYTDCTFRFVIDQNSSWVPAGNFENLTRAIIDNVSGEWYLHVQAKDSAGNLSEVVTVSTILKNTDPLIPESERQALIDLYNSAGGDNWKYNTGWLGEVGTECSWVGVTCNIEKSNVIQLDLGFHKNSHTVIVVGRPRYYGNNLQGEVPKSIENLIKLEKLDLHNNGLSSVPAEIGNLTNLTFLDLSANSLTSIPSEIANLTNLTELDLNGNNLFSLPSEIIHFNELINIRGNALEISDDEIIQFLDSKDLNWWKYQTVSPKELNVKTITNDSITLTWSMIDYQLSQGGYEIYYSQGSNESYTIYNRTDDKSIEQMVISELLSNTTYYFKARSVTYHSLSLLGIRPNTVYSKFTNEISAKTLLIAIAKHSLSAVTNDTSISIEITGNNVDYYKYKFNQNAWTEYLSIETPITLTSLEDGPYTLLLMGKDNAGSLQYTPSVYTWRVDTHVENFNINQPEGIDDAICLWAFEPKNMTLSGTRETQSILSVDTSFSNDITISYPDVHTWTAHLTNMHTGNYTLLFQATDIAGNQKNIEKRIHLTAPDSANIETQTNSLLADNTQTLSMIVSFFSKDQEQVCIDPNVRIESTMGEILEKSRLIANNQLMCLLKADSRTGTAHISTVFDNNTLGNKEIEMVPGPFDRIGFHCDDPVQEVGMAGKIITLHLEDAYGHPVSVLNDLDIQVNSTAKSDGEFYIKQNNVWTWQQEMFVNVLKANSNAFNFLFRTSIPGKHSLNAFDFEHNKTGSLDITVMDQPDIQFRHENSEIDESGKWTQVEIKLNRITDQDVWVEYITEIATENNASQGLDYEFSTELEVTISAGEMSCFIPLTIINDDFSELNETVLIKLVNANINIGSKNLHTLSIIDDEPQPSPPQISGPNSPTNTKSPKLCWTSGGGSQTYRYKIDDHNLAYGADETASNCYQPSYGLVEGNHVFYVQEYNAHTKQWSDSSEYSIQIDTGRPCSEAQSPPGIDAQLMHFEITYTYADIYSGEICGNPLNTGSGLSHVELWGMGPQDKEYTLITTDSGDFIDGKFLFVATNDGAYRFFTCAIDLAGNVEIETDKEFDTQTIFSKDFSGYAILAVGAIDGQKGLASHTFSANKIYRHLISRKLGMLYDIKDPLDHIKYFNPHYLELSGVDPFDTHQNYPEALENAITEWALDHICRLPGPLYIILIDHGGTDKFYLSGSNDWLDASDLNQWITSLENSIQQHDDVPLHEIIIILDTCYSGSFMNDLIKPGSSRIVITSTAENELSFRGPKSPVSDLLVRDGAFFASNLFNELSKGVNLGKSFERAVKRTEILSGSYSIIPKYPFYDHASQHPLLDDNGIHPGHNILYSSGDGNRAKEITLGYEQYSHALPEIDKMIILPDRPLHASENSVDIHVRVKSPDEMLKVFMEIRTPDDKLPKTVNEQLQKELDMIQINLMYNQAEGLYQETCDKFNRSGKYTLFFYLQDSENTMYYANQTYVYKRKENNHPPWPFQLIYPMNLDDPENIGSKETESFQVIFQWDDTKDPESDRFSYTLWLSTNSQFETDVIKQEDIMDLQYLIELPETWDGNDIYWRVQAIDDFGASVDSDIFRFKLDDKNTSLEKTIAFFHVYDSQTQRPLPGAKIHFGKEYDSVEIMTSNRGFFIHQFDPRDTIELTIAAATYETSYTKIYTKDASMITIDIPLMPHIQTGDINRDEYVNIGDVIWGLQLLSGVQLSYNFYAQGALDAEDVRLADMIYILRLISGVD